MRLQSVFLLGKPLGIETVGFDYVRSGFEIASVYGRNEVWTGQHQMVIVAVRCGKGLYDCAHCTVEHKDSVFYDFSDMHQYTCLAMASTLATAFIE